MKRQTWSVHRCDPAEHVRVSLQSRSLPVSHSPTHSERFGIPRRAGMTRPKRSSRTST